MSGFGRTYWFLHLTHKKGQAALACPQSLIFFSLSIFFFLLFLLLIIIFFIAIKNQAPHCQNFSKDNKKSKPNQTTSM
jgi:TRAP-type C4-dicarboxylate transport system permease small subunit